MTSLPNDELNLLRQKLSEVKLPPLVAEKVETQLVRLSRLTGSDYSQEADRTVRWVEWLISLPWNNKASAQVDLVNAQQILDQNHYDLTDVKERILEYLAVVKLKGADPARAPILLLVGLVGTGKTSLAFSIAEALNRPLARIPFGGLGSARDLRGQSRLFNEAEPGLIIKSIRQTGVNNPVILLDELDRIAEDSCSDVMGVLVELLDPEQNRAFLDHYLDVSFDLSQVIFIGTANNTTNIATAVLDRMEPLSLPSYSDDDKIAIAKGYLLPKIINETGLSPQTLIIDDNIWPQIVRPLGYDAGIRTLQRTIQTIARKTAKEIVTGQKPSVHITLENLREYVERW